MSSYPSDEVPVAAFVCNCKESARTACKGLPFFKEHEGKRYCVLHYPGKDKVVAFNKVLKRKLNAQDFDFRGACFPDDVDFSNFTFTTPVDFSSATFNSVVNFNSATFSSVVNFNSATFSSVAYFNSATFNKAAYFGYATFSSEVNFGYATFSSVEDFGTATFNAVADFGTATFKDYVRFAAAGEKSSLNLQFARIEKPDRLSFHTLTLRPHWFVNVDARRFEFINVKWNWQDINIWDEIHTIDGGTNLSAHRLLAIACRNLALNAEENHRYEEASRFRYMAMDARRLENPLGFAPWTLNWWYWLASGYGERTLRALFVLVLIWLSFSLIYFKADCTSPTWFSKQICVAWEQKQGVESPRGDWPRSLAYTLNVVTLQKPEPRPVTPAAQMIVTLSTILGPVQAALLALAIRRKFMR